MSEVRSETIQYVTSLPAIVQLGILVTHDDVKRDLQALYPKANNWHGVPMTLGEFFDLQKGKMDTALYGQIVRETGLGIPPGFTL